MAMVVARLHRRRPHARAAPRSRRRRRVRRSRAPSPSRGRRPCSESTVPSATDPLLAARRRLATRTSSGSRRSTTCRSPCTGARRSRCSAPTAAASRRCSRCSTGCCSPTRARYRAFGDDVTEDHLEDEQFSRGFRSRRRLRVPELRRAGVLADGARGDRVRAAEHGSRPRRGRTAGSTTRSRCSGSPTWPTARRTSCRAGRRSGSRSRRCSS